MAMCALQVEVNITHFPHTSVKIMFLTLFMFQAVRAGIASVFPPRALSILGPHGLLQALGSLKVRVHDSFSFAAR